MNYGKKIALFRSSSRSVESESVFSFDDLEDDEKDNVKRKTRNLSEKKRRDQFNVLINELCSMVAANTKKMDKSTVLKSAIQFLRNHQEFSVQSAANEIKEDWKPTFLCNEEFAQLMLEAVDSFLVVFNQQGKVLFTSDSVTSLLGHIPADLINHSLYDLMHEDDRLKFFTLLSKHSQGILDDNSISFTCHLRRGTIDPGELPTYEYVRVFGTCQVIGDMDDNNMNNDHNDFISLDLPEQSLCFCCTVRLQTSHIIREMSTVDENTCEFTSRHSLEWKFLFLDHRAPPIIGYLPFEVLGTSGYDYYHPDDLESVSKCHEQLMVMGKGTSSFYRFLTKGQQWIWLQTRYYITYHQWNSKPEFIVCTNTVVGYHDVRKQVRQEMGYIDEDSTASVCNSSLINNSSVNSGSGQGDNKEACVSSYSHADTIGMLGGKIVQSPDVASTQHSDGERSQVPHSTKQESSTRKHVRSQLQSLLQLHLQRSSLAAATSSQSAQTSGSTSSMNGISTVQAGLAGSSQTVVTSSANLTARNQGAVGRARLLPIMAATMPSSMVNMSSSQRLTSTVPTTPSSQSVAIVSSPLTSPAICTNQQQASFQTGLILTPAQQLLHDQLVHKSEQLQTAIQQQQEELRQIKEQLAYAQGGSVVPQQQQQQVQMQQQPQLRQQQQQHQQQSQQLQQQQQYILQQRLGMGPQSMLLTSGGQTEHQLAMMGSSPQPIFLSPIANLNMDLSSHQSQPQEQQQQPQNQLQQQQPHHYQQAPIVLQHEEGMGPHSMLLTPGSPSSASHQLAMMAPGPNSIFLSPITMDLSAQQQQQQQQLQTPSAPQSQTLCFAVTSHTSSDPNSNTVDLSDSC